MSGVRPGLLVTHSHQCARVSSRRGRGKDNLHMQSYKKEQSCQVGGAECRLAPRQFTTQHSLPDYPFLWRTTRTLSAEGDPS